MSTRNAAVEYVLPHWLGRTRARSLGTCARLAGKDSYPIACDIFSHQRAIDYFLACAAFNRMLCLAAKGRLYG